MQVIKCKKGVVKAERKKHMNELLILRVVNDYFKSTKGIKYENLNSAINENSKESIFYIFMKYGKDLITYDAELENLFEELFTTKLEFPN